MTPKPSSNQRRSPRQARSRATCEAIAEAAAQILERGGAAALTTTAVAERAGVSIGTLYQYFPDKQAIVLAAARRELADADLAKRPAALVQALIAALERITGLGVAASGGLRTAARSSRRPGAALERRFADLLEWLFAPPAPALRPIPIRRRRL
jgi:AcrR family transcriptional regulator